MTARTNFLLTAFVTGGTATIAAAIGLVGWRMRWPLDLAWAGLAFILVWPLVIGYVALWRPAPPREQLERACAHLVAAVYLAIISSMLLLQEALVRTR